MNSSPGCLPPSTLFLPIPLLDPCLGESPTPLASGQILGLTLPLPPTASLRLLPIPQPDSPPLSRSRGEGIAFCPPYLSLLP